MTSVGMTESQSQQRGRGEHRAEEAKEFWCTLRLFGDETSVEDDGGVDHFLGGEILFDAKTAGFGHFLCGGGIAEKLQCGIAELCGIGSFDEETAFAVFDDFAERTAIE